MSDEDQKLLAEQLKQLGFSTDLSIPSNKDEDLTVYYKNKQVTSLFLKDNLQKTANELEKNLCDVGADQKSVRLFITYFIQEYLKNRKLRQENNNDKHPIEIYIQKFSVNGILLEAILIAGKPYFLVATDKDNSISIQQSIELENKILRPLEKDSYLSRPYSFSSEEQVKVFIERAKEENLKTLFQKTKSIWKKYIDADDFHISICAADSIYTYFQDRLGLTHYLFFIGDNTSGKSNNLRIINILAYRNFTSTDITPANIYQFLGSVEEGQGTLSVDEADHIDSNNDLMRIFKNGYTAGFPVARIDTVNGRKQQRFFTFCFKAFSAERLPDSLIAKGFNQRIIPLPCMYGIPQYDISEVLNPAGEQEYQQLIVDINELRNSLLIYRLLHYHEKIPEIKVNLAGREKQLFKPVIRVFQNTEILKELLPIISNYVVQRRECNANSFIAFLYRTVKDLIRSKNTTELESSLIWNTITDLLPGHEISNRKLSYDSAEFGIVSQKGITETLIQIIGATQSSNRREKRKLIFDKSKLDRLGAIYDLSIEVKVGTSVTDVTDMGLDKHFREQSEDKETTIAKQENLTILTTNTENNEKITLRQQERDSQPFIDPSQVSHQSPTNELEEQREKSEVIEWNFSSNYDEGDKERTFLDVFEELSKDNDNGGLVDYEKLRLRLISTGKFFAGDAVLIIDHMERIGQIEETGFHLYRKKSPHIGDGSKL